MATKEEYIDVLGQMEELYYNNDNCTLAMNLFKEDINLLTRLVNEHFEEEETNAEHYLNDLLKIGRHFCFMHGEVKNCCDVGCAFCTFGKANCDKERFKWLASPYKKSANKLTKFENDLLQSYVEGNLRKCKFKDIWTLNRMKEKGYFKGIDDNEIIGDILANCEVMG